MKKLSIMLAVLFAIGSSVAHADSIRLNDIDTNDCAKAQYEVNILNLPRAGIQVMTQCSPYIYMGYPSNNGRVYNYRLYTTVNFPGPIYPGQSFRLNDIDTNDCAWAQNEISILNSPQFRVTAVCSPYVYMGYPSDNGRVYNYRLYTTVTRNY